MSAACMSQGFDGAGVIHKSKLSGSLPSFRITMASYTPSHIGRHKAIAIHLPSKPLLSSVVVVFGSSQMSIYQSMLRLSSSVFVGVPIMASVFPRMMAISFIASLPSIFF